MKIIAILLTGSQLLPGDLFSSAGPSYWDRFPHLSSIGERVYIRTCTPCPPDQESEPIYRLTIHPNEED